MWDKKYQCPICKYENETNLTNHSEPITAQVCDQCGEYNYIKLKVSVELDVICNDYWHDFFIVNHEDSHEVKCRNCSFSKIITINKKKIIVSD